MTTEAFIFGGVGGEDPKWSSPGFLNVRVAWGVCIIGWVGGGSTGGRLWAGYNTEETLTSCILSVTLACAKSNSFSLSGYIKSSFCSLTGNRYRFAFFERFTLWWWMLLNKGFGGIGLFIINEFIWKAGPEAEDENKELFDMDILSSCRPARMGYYIWLQLLRPLWLNGNPFIVILTTGPNESSYCWLSVLCDIVAASWLSFVRPSDEQDPQLDRAFICAFEFLFFPP